MSRSLTAQDRSALIRLASDLPKGSPERRSVLAGLQKDSFFEREVDPKAVLRYFSDYFSSPYPLAPKQDPDLYKFLKGDWDNAVLEISKNLSGDLDAVSRKYRVPPKLAPDWKTLIRVVEDVLYR